MTKTKLNKDQRAALECLRRNRDWCGQWLIGGSTKTRRLLNELADLGMATRHSGQNHFGAYQFFKPV